MAEDGIPHYTAPKHEFSAPPILRSTPRERAATAVADKMGDLGMLREVDPLMSDFDEIAVAVLKAIREPSEVMVSAGAPIIAQAANWGDCGGPAPVSDANPYAVGVHHAMIDAALEEGR